MELGSQELYVQIGRTISAIGSTTFIDELISSINHIAAYDQAVIICYEKDTAPAFWYSHLSKNKKKAVIHRYLSGYYLLDPWYNAFLEDMSDGLYFLDDVAPDNFFESEFYLEYYKAIKVDNEAVFSVRLSDKRTIQISLGLIKEENNANKRERLSTILPVITASAKKHWACDQVAEKKAQPSLIHLHVSYAFNHFGEHLLSIREREVAILIIKGYSLKSIAELLQVAFGTVKVHCKNMYKKLDINSQSELFSLFIDEIKLSTPDGV